MSKPSRRMHSQDQICGGAHEAEVVGKLSAYHQFLDESINSGLSHINPGFSIVDGPPFKFNTNATKWIQILTSTCNNSSSF